jgi:hypothetical protein
MSAAKLGRVAVLDGIDNLPEGMLTVLQELLVDSSITLVDGTVFKSAESYERLKHEEGLDDAEMARRGIFAVHPSFRVIATAKLPSGTSAAKGSGRPWLTGDIPSMFNTLFFRVMPTDCLTELVTSIVESSCHTSSRAIAKQIASVLQLQSSLRELQSTDPKIPQLTMRQVIHVACYGAQFHHS